MIPLAMTTFPLLAGLVLTIIPARWTGFHRGIPLAGTLLSFAAGVWLWIAVPVGEAGGDLTGLLYRINGSWFPDPFGASFHVAVDGISMVFALLSALLATLAVLFSWIHVRRRERAYYSLLMFLAGGMLGVFFARDLLLFYLFWEAMLLPMYFLVGIWGGERRLYASMKFILYTLAGSLLMLVAMVVLYQLHLDQFGHASMGLEDLYRLRIPGWTALPLFLAFLVSFAIKTPLFPLHTWLPDAHVEAPSAGSVILAGILLKVGIYGFIRLLIPLFPALALGWGSTLALLAAAGILYGGLVAWSQRDIKKLVAYSSVSHLGFVVLGLFTLTAAGVTAGIVQGVVHGINTGGLFLLVGMLYGRVHVRDMESIGELASRLPVFATILVIMALASVGLPATNGFVGEFLVLAASFDVFPIYTVLAALGVVVSVLYMFRMMRRCVFGEAGEVMDDVPDLNGLEVLVMLPLVVLVFWIGLYPGPLIERVQPSVRTLLSDVPESRRLSPEVGPAAETIEMEFESGEPDHD